ncbi:MAG: ATP-binding cassette domain-containing protein [Pseudomonadota bacterium]
MQSAIYVRDLVFSHGDAHTLSIEEFELPGKQSRAVMGPSGCGKTTFVQLLAGLLKPHAGSVKVLGTDLSTLSGSEADRFRGQHIGFVFQQLHLFPALTVKENLRLAQRLARSPADEEYLHRLLTHLGVENLGQRRPDQLSFGQMQRVAVARALAHKPALLIADEPTSSLDNNNAAATIDLLMKSAEEAEAALLVVTHDERLRGRLDGEYPLGGGE